MIVLKFNLLMLTECFSDDSVLFFVDTGFYALQVVDVLVYPS